MARNIDSRGDAVEVATRQAVRDVVFLLELVIRLNVAAAETIRVEGLRYAALWWEARAITAETELLPASQSPSGRRATTRRWATRQLASQRASPQEQARRPLGLW